MKIGRVAGTVVATICSPVFENRTLLFVDLLDLDGNETGKDVIARTIHFLEGRPQVEWSSGSTRSRPW